MLLGISTALVTALALSLLPLRPIEAQGTARVQVALVETLSSPDARAEVVRFSTGRPDLILLRSSSVTTDDVAVALLTLEQVRGDRPARPGLIGRTTLVGAGRAPGADTKVMRRADTILRELKGSPTARIGNLGRGRWGEFDALH